MLKGGNSAGIRESNEINLRLELRWDFSLSNIFVISHDLFMMLINWLFNCIFQFDCTIEGVS